MSDNDKEVYVDAKFRYNGRDLIVRRSWYSYGNGRQPAFLCFDEADEECNLESGIPYGVLTINLDHSATEWDERDFAYMQFIDTNNWPGIEDILKDVTWCQPIGAYVQSGFCTYPIYIFNSAIEEVKTW